MVRLDAPNSDKAENDKKKRVRIEYIEENRFGLLYNISTEETNCVYSQGIDVTELLRHFEDV